MGKLIDYISNCVFVDESGFNINTCPPSARSAVGAPAIVTTKSIRATSRMILGAISAMGVVEENESRHQTPEEQKALRQSINLRELVHEMHLDTTELDTEDDSDSDYTSSESDKVSEDEKMYSDNSDKDNINHDKDEVDNLLREAGDPSGQSNSTQSL
ncbi:hypothetical protein G6F56_004726 [Rhizopus delemar]|nr:hypothetical protein G6F56_004726 [Rhizopus delemar]